MELKYIFSVLTEHIYFFQIVIKFSKVTQAKKGNSTVSSCKTVEVFICRLCPSNPKESQSLDAMIAHIKKEHESEDSDNSSSDDSDDSRGSDSDSDSSSMVT